VDPGVGSRAPAEERRSGGAEERTIPDQERIAGRDEDASTQRVQVQVNGVARRVPAPHHVSQLLEMLGMADRRVAVAVNRQVLLRSQRSGFELAEGDRVEILEAVGGG